MASQSIQRPHIITIGGGIAGPAIALFLKQAGFNVSVYEAYPHTSKVGGGFNIAPNGMHVLSELGIANEIQNKATQTPNVNFLSAKGSSLGKMTYGSVDWYGNPAVSMSRAILYTALANAMKERGISMHYEKKVQRVVENKDDVTVYFEDGTSATGDIVIGADGVNSIVRRCILPDGPLPEYTGMIGVGGFTSIDAISNLSEERIKTINFVFGTNFFGYGGADTGTILWWANLWQEKQYTPEELRNLDEEEIKQELLKLYETYHEPIPQLIKNTNIIIRHNVFDIQSLPTWHKGRICLIGDAAHAVSPNSGQGASLALEDALCLAKLLRDSKFDFENSFEKFEIKRKERVEQIIQEGRRRGEGKQTTSPFKAWIRNQFMKVMFTFMPDKKNDVMAYKEMWNEEK